MTDRRLALAAGIAGFAGALCLFVGDQQFALAAAPPWGPGLKRLDPIVLGTLLAVPGGVGLVLGLDHLKARLCPAPRWARVTVMLLLLTLFIHAAAAQAVMGAAHLTEDGGWPDASNNNVYLFLLMPLRDLGGVVSILAALGLLTLTLLGRTAWPRWMALANPVLLYFMFDKVSFRLAVGNGPLEPVGDVISVGLFSFTWMIVFAVSVLAPWRGPKP